MADAGLAGAEKLRIIGARFKSAGDGRLSRDTLIATRRVTQPLISGVEDSARNVLPRAGGLGAKVASQKFTVTASLVQDKVTVSGSGMRELGDIDKGEVRHSVFNNREVWVSQKVTPRFFTRPVEERVPEVRHEVSQVMARTADELGRPV